MLDKESKGKVRTGEWGQLMSLLGTDFTKSKLAYVNKDVDRAGKSGLAVCGCGCSLGLWSPVCVSWGRCSERRKGGPGSWS